MRIRKHRAFDYMDWGFGKILILPRHEGTEYTEECVFCNQRHMHGIADVSKDSKRSSHCSFPKRSTYEEVTHPDGTVIRRDAGYYVQTIPKSRVRVINTKDFAQWFIPLLELKAFWFDATQYGAFSAQRMLALHKLKTENKTIIIKDIRELVDAPLEINAAIETIRVLSDLTKKNYIIINHG